MSRVERVGLPVPRNESLTTLRPIVDEIMRLITDRGYEPRCDPVVTADQGQYYNIGIKFRTLVFNVFQNVIICCDLGGVFDKEMVVLGHCDPEQFDKIDKIIRGTYVRT
jgi:hypothetical protein